MRLALLGSQPYDMYSSNSEQRTDFLKERLWLCVVLHGRKSDIKRNYGDVKLCPLPGLSHSLNLSKYDKETFSLGLLSRFNLKSYQKSCSV